MTRPPVRTGAVRVPGLDRTTSGPPAHHARRGRAGFPTSARQRRGRQAARATRSSSTPQRARAPAAHARRPRPAPRRSAGRVGGEPIDQALREAGSRDPGRARLAASVRHARSASARRRTAAGSGGRGRRWRTGSSASGTLGPRAMASSDAAPSRRTTLPVTPGMASSSSSVRGRRAASSTSVLVPQDHERRPVQLERQPLAQSEELAQHGEAAAVEVLGALELQVRVGIRAPASARRARPAPRTPRRARLAAPRRVDSSVRRSRSGVRWSTSLSA